MIFEHALIIILDFVILFPLKLREAQCECSFSGRFPGMHDNRCTPLKEVYRRQYQGAPDNVFCRHRILQGTHSGHG